MTRIHPSSSRARRRVARSTLMPAQSRNVTSPRSRASCDPYRRNTRSSSSRSCGADWISISPQISTTGGAPGRTPTRRSAGSSRCGACCPGRLVGGMVSPCRLAAKGPGQAASAMTECRVTARTPRRISEVDHDLNMTGSFGVNFRWKRTRSVRPPRVCLCSGP